MAQDVTVRRAKPSDAGNIAAFVNRGRKGQAVVDEMTVIERFGNVGLMVAEQGGDLVGILGWRAENLVARVTDLLIAPGSGGVVVARALLSEMEQAAVELQCEVAFLFLPRPYSPKLIEFCGSLGYEPQVAASLPKAWQDATREVRIDGDDPVLLKQLRSGRVARPL